MQPINKNFKLSYGNSVVISSIPRMMKSSCYVKILGQGHFKFFNIIHSIKPYNDLKPQEKFMGYIQKDKEHMNLKALVSGNWQMVYPLKFVTDSQIN